MCQDYRRGDIFYADLSPVIGSEQGGRRPVLILQNDVGNQHSPTTIVAAVTSKAATKAKLPVHVALPGGIGLEKDSIVLLEQVRTIDKARFDKYVGRLDDASMQKVDKSLSISVGLSKKIDWSTGIPCKCQVCKCGWLSRFTVLHNPKLPWSRCGLAASICCSSKTHLSSIYSMRLKKFVNFSRNPLTVEYMFNYNIVG